MSSVQIRAAKPSDKTVLGQMRHALWPDSSVEHHEEELVPILAGKSPGIMLWFISSRKKTERSLDLSRSACDRRRTDATGRARSATSKDGTSPDLIAAAESARNSSPLQKIGRANKAAPRWLPTRSPTMPNHFKRICAWAMKSLNAPSCSARVCAESHDMLYSLSLDILYTEWLRDWLQCSTIVEHWSRRSISRNRVAQ